MHRLVRYSHWVTSFLLVGCRRPLQDGVAVVRDSLQVEIVEYRAAALDQVPRWRPSATPVFSLPSRDDDPHYQFLRIRDAQLLRSGGIAIVDRGVNRILVYDGNGDFERAVGRDGDGPGEFRALSWIALVGDSLAAYDSRHRRVSVFDARWRLVRETTITGMAQEGRRSAGSLKDVIGIFSDGTLLGRTITAPTRLTPGVRLATQLIRIGVDGSFAGVVADAAGEQVDVIESPNGGPMVAPMMFARTSVVGISGDRVFIGDTERWEIQALDESGLLRRVIRLDRPPVAVTDSVWARALTAVLPKNLTGAEHDRAVRTLRARTQHRTLPAFGDLRLASDGRIWVGDYPVSADEPTLWSVFEPNGILVALVEVPGEWTILRFEAKGVVAIVRDSLERDNVGLFPLVVEPRR